MFGKRYPNCVKKEETQLEDSRLTSSNDMQSKMYADKNKSGKKMSDDEIKKEKGGKEFLARLKSAKEKMKKEGTSYGIYKGDGKPKGAMAKFGEKKKKEKKIVLTYFFISSIYTLSIPIQRQEKPNSKALQLVF